MTGRDFPPLFTSVRKRVQQVDHRKDFAGIAVDAIDAVVVAVIVPAPAPFEIIAVIVADAVIIAVQRLAAAVMFAGMSERLAVIAFLGQTRRA